MVIKNRLPDLAVRCRHSRIDRSSTLTDQPPAEPVFKAPLIAVLLADRGVDKARLSSKGFGMTKPIDSNDTDDGRQNNRRVEFQILEKDGKPFTE